MLLNICVPVSLQNAETVHPVYTANLRFVIGFIYLLNVVKERLFCFANQTAPGTFILS